MIRPSARIPESNMSAYIRSTPKAPLSGGDAEFLKGERAAIVQPAKNNAYYIGRLKQHLDDFDRDLAEWKASGEWKKDYKTWGAACEIALNMSQRHANRLISEYEEQGINQSVQTGHKCPAEPDTEKAHESDIRMSLPDPLADLEAQIAKPAVHAGPAPQTEVAKKPAAAPKPPDVPRDLIGFPIPKDLLPVWNRRQEVQERMTLVSKLRSAVETFCAGKDRKSDPLYSNRMAWQHPLENLNAIYFNLSECKPDVVCPICGGTLVDNRLKNKAECEECRHVGFISEHKWTAVKKSSDPFTKPLIAKHLSQCNGHATS